VRAVERTEQESSCNDTIDASLCLYVGGAEGGAENAGVENAGVENTGAITYGKPSNRNRQF